METDYMFAVQELCFKLIYIPPTIKEEKPCWYMIGNDCWLIFFNPNQQWSVATQPAIWTMFNIKKLLWDFVCSTLWTFFKQGFREK